MFDVHDCIAFLTNQGAKAVTEAMNEWFKTENLTRTQWTALYFVSQQNRITQKELAQTMLISEPSALHLVERLEKRGLLVRINDPDNFRAKLLFLTEKGRRALEELLPLVERFNEVGTRNIPSRDMEVFKRVMAQMIQNVSQADGRDFSDEPELLRSANG